MKVTYKSADGRLTAELEGDTQADLWRQIANFQEVFESALTCTKNGVTSTNVILRVRTDKDDNEYFEALCVDDNPKVRLARRSYGQLKNPKGGLFPRTKDKDGNKLPDFGWVQWDGQKEV